MENTKVIVLFHALGQSSFKYEEIAQKFNSLEELMESDILTEIPNREKSLTQLWEAAHTEIPEELKAEDVSQTEERLQEEETLQTY